MGEDVSRVNRAHWDVWAAAHGQDAYYDTEGLVAGADSLTDVERAVLGEVKGLDVLHVQCHIGFDAISLARSGARVTGVDFSPVSLEKARGLAERCGVDVRFVEADATDLPEQLRGRFDLAYAAYGILCWIADVDAWMRSVASTLRPGGRLVLVDFHPLLTMVETVEPLALDFPYAFDGPHEYTSSQSYAGETEPTTSVEFAHSLGEIVTAAATAGLRVTRLEERLDAALDLGRGTPVGPDGRYRFPVDGRHLPVLYALVATR
ncbi:class I SAM-dependent methyltransferase [Actinomadura terrae]|uniref:class I SAM-dependent methyltransferase n=1 Tax=Actinomadura terrae TaxID=604353 RepID=UPI001FA7443D|nr:class I SAM-dependent methyltransferase [Actinomadura terrae]